MGFESALISLPQDKFDFLIKNGKRSHALNDYDFESLCYSSYKFVKETAPDLIKEGKFERLIFECFIDRKIYIFENDINNFDFNECLYFVLWIIDDLKYWSKMEQEHLSGEPDMDMMLAGINELNIFGDLNVIDMLAGGDVLKWEEVKKMTYQKIFDKQLKTIKEGKFQKEYSKRMADKNKPKKN